MCIYARNLHVHTIPSLEKWQANHDMSVYMAQKMIVGPYKILPHRNKRTPPAKAFGFSLSKGFEVKQKAEAHLLLR
jgi:hypothetical protein